MDFTVYIPSRIEYLRDIEKLIDQVTEEYNIDERIYGRLSIACMELVRNSIIHGNRLDPEKEVKVSIRVTNDKLLIRSKDQGTGFDYDNLPDPTSPENLEKTDGRGIFLIRNLSDKLTFSKNGRVAKLEFNLK